MIDFELPPRIQQLKDMLYQVAINVMRPVAREMDEHEHERSPDNFINLMWKNMKNQRPDYEKIKEQAEKGESESEEKQKQEAGRSLTMVVLTEELSYGDCGIYLTLPYGLGAAAVDTVGTIDQKIRFMKRFREENPTWGAMAITEPHCGSDTSAIRTTAVREGDEWVINGEKIFVTAGNRAVVETEGFVVVWATVDRSAGRAGIKSFIVEHGTPGMTVTKIEHKLGIKTSDTAAIVFEDCRIPLDNVLGSPEVIDTSKTQAYKGVMKTFDATRPAIAASAIGVGRAALEFVQDLLKQKGLEIHYDAPFHKLTALERDVIDMAALLKVARHLTWRAAWMADKGKRNSLEAAMAKAKAGLAVTHITQKSVEIMGPLGYSREFLAEKWMRDAKINDLFEGTGQINTLIVARQILGYTREQLK
jgi:acyl-CoA dehydrogenase